MGTSLPINTDPILVKQNFDAPVTVVWKAITDKEQMRQWFFAPMSDFEPEVGFKTQFNVRVEDRDYLHLWKVTEVIWQKRIAYDWRYGGFDGDSSVAWDLSETTDGTKLCLCHKGHETFSRSDSIFSRENGQAGWEYFLQQSLKAFLE